MLVFEFFDGKKDNLQDAFHIREEVFVKEQGFSAELEFDALDAGSIHIVGYMGGQPICTGRMFEETEQVGMMHIGRICVSEKERGKHIGNQMLQQLIKYAKKQSAMGVMLAAQEHAVPFYEKLGLEKYGTVFYDEGVPHVMMKLLF